MKVENESSMETLAIKYSHETRFHINEHGKKSIHTLKKMQMSGMKCDVRLRFQKVAH